MKREFWNHDRFCTRAVSIEPATTWGRLYHLPAGFTDLEVSDCSILTHGTADPLADTRTQKLDEQKSEKQHKRIVLDIFIKNLSAKKRALDSFNNKIWMATIDRVMVSKTGQLTFRFKDGTEICR